MTAMIPEVGKRKDFRKDGCNLRRAIQQLSVDLYKIHSDYMHGIEISFQILSEKSYQ